LDHAAVWNLSTGAYSALDAPGFDQSTVWGARGGLLAGAAFTFIGGYRVQAMIWSATTHGGVSLHPTGAIDSGTYATDGIRHGGWATFAGSTNAHAILWKNGADDYVDLTPQIGGYDGAIVRTVDRQHQAGYATLNGGYSHAMLWSGTAQSAVDLHPGGVWTFSNVNGIFGEEQVGAASNGGVRAAMWHGTAASFVSLAPPGMLGSSGLSATNGTQQVGFVFVGAGANGAHAFVWSGTAESALDLHQFLPIGFIASSALDIDASGNIFGYADDVQGNSHAVAWLVPEPSSVTGILLLTCGWLTVRCRGVSGRSKLKIEQRGGLSPNKP
jgi:hypothetical protein